MGDPDRGRYQALANDILEFDPSTTTTLTLSDRQITELPPEVGRLKRLTSLFLAGNGLETLPPEIGELTSLKIINLDNNRLQAIPSEIGNLSSLRHLKLSNNQIKAFPPQIGNLTHLKVLEADGNLLESLPPDIGNLTNLQVLRLQRNRLRELPPDLANLGCLNVGDLRNNPLREPLPEIIARGTEQLIVYLQSLRDATRQYEAKVLLVGEGNVGKTSLVAALRGDPFVKDRSTTHGIELQPLVVRHPELDSDMILNTWDFGGQEVYRITHQFFFSRRALYLLIWRPREGQEENAIEGWIRRIRLRVGNDARIMIVATHSDERRPELDYPALKHQFGDLLVGNYAVDNLSERGIDELRQAIAREAAALPQMGELVSLRWIKARDEISARPEPQILYEDLIAICTRHGLTSADILAWSGLLHDLGHIIHYGDDEGLKDIVVLRPEWLTKAIGYVLEDSVTRQNAGILNHARLAEVWRDRPREMSYPVAYHPYFLRLMEKFDVSYRLPDDANASLVAQLAPYERPMPLWDEEMLESLDIRRLTLVCSLSEPAPGFMAWLTVRNHRFSCGRHWRSGVFLQHRSYASQALFEFVDPLRLSLEVKAPSPDYFFSILRDSVEDLIARRWPGLKYDFEVPCPTPLEAESMCVGRFKLRVLIRFREEGQSRIVCQECIKWHDVSSLLTGFPLESLPSAPVLDEMAEKLNEVSTGVQRLEGYAADIAGQVRRVLTVVSTEVNDCPRLFTLTPERSSWRQRWSRAFWQQRYVLTLWCEHPGQWHPWYAARYPLVRPREWLQTASPYILTISKTLRLMVPIVGSMAGVFLDEDEFKQMEREVDLMKAIADKLPEHLGVEMNLSEVVHEQGRAEGAGLRALRVLLHGIDQSQSYGGLRRVQDSTGDFLWICERHYSQYDPGLPSLPYQ